HPLRRFGSSHQSARIGGVTIGKRTLRHSDFQNSPANPWVGGGIADRQSDGRHRTAGSQQAENWQGPSHAHLPPGQVATYRAKTRFAAQHNGETAVASSIKWVRTRVRNGVISGVFRAAGVSAGAGATVSVGGSFLH